MNNTLKKIKKTVLRPVGATVNRINFVKLVEKLAAQEPGQSFAAREGASEPAFTDQEDIIQRTIQLTAADLSERGERVNLKEIEDYARAISCRYQPELHRSLKAAVCNAMGHLFEHDDPGHMFISEDRRELPYLDRLLQARRDGVGVVYLLNHSSHWDEFIHDLVLEQMGIQLPLFAAGSNMMATPSVEELLMNGSYVIIRKGATKTYLSTLFQYCRALGELGKQQGIFLEAWSGGARTRDGSLRYPRRLVTLQGALASERDVLVQPAVISYSVVPEDLGLSERAGGLSWINGLPFLRSWLRRPHRPLSALIQGAAGLFGRAYLTMCEPRMVSELEVMRAEDPNDLALDEFVALYSMKEIARQKKVMASQLTARGLIRARSEDSDDLVASTEAELDDVIEYHRRTFGHDPDLEDFILKNNMDDVVADGLAALKRRKIIGRPSGTRNLPEVRVENGLQYYATHGDRRLYSPSAKENIVVVGAGSWGYGLACHIGRLTLGDKAFLNSSLTMFDAREDLIREILDTRGQPIFFPEIRLPKNVFPAVDATAAFRKATEVVVSGPVDFFESDVRRLLAEAPQPISLIIATRGFEQAGHRLPVQIARQVLRETGRSDVSLLVLSGPITPLKLAEGRGGALVLAGPPNKTRVLARLFDDGVFHVDTCDDPIGVQLAAVMAEVYSLLGAYLIRTKEMQGRGQIATFIKETSREVMDLAVALGGKRVTFLPDNPAWAAEYIAAGLGGPGAAFGRKAGKSLTRAKQSALEFLKHAPGDLREEGVQLIGYTGIRSAYHLARKHNVKAPLLRQAYRIFWKDYPEPEV